MTCPYLPDGVSTDDLDRWFMEDPQPDEDDLEALRREVSVPQASVDDWDWSNEEDRDDDIPF